MKYTFETDDTGDAKRLINASDNYFLLWELKHNFWRKWKHGPPKDYQEILDALQEALEGFVDLED